MNQRFKYSDFSSDKKRTIDQAALTYLIHITLTYKMLLNILL